MTTQLTWLGHGAWSIQIDEHQVLLDPFLNESPVAPIKADEVDADVILVSLFFHRRNLLGTSGTVDIF